MATFDPKVYKREDMAHLLHGFVDQREFAESGSAIIVEANGVRIKDIDGKEYIEARSGSMSVNIGYGRVELAEVAKSQMSKMPFYVSFGGGANVQEIELARKLSELTPSGLQRFMFTNSGSDAVETALKIARFYWRAKGQNKYKIISLDRSYHGATYGAMSVGGAPAYSKNFEPLVPGFIHIVSPYCYRCPLGRSYPGCDIDCAHSLERTIESEGEDTVAAFMSEPMVGVAGYVLPPPEYWPKIMEICKKHHVLLIIDEVITGFGRTGKFFASEHWGIQPDMMTMSKGLASSYMPMAGTVISEEIYRSIREMGAAFLHVFTFGGHPVGCAVALKNIEIILEEKLVDNAARMGEYLQHRLGKVQEQSPYIGAVRGLGLWCGVELVADKGTKATFAPEKKVAKGVLSRCRERGIILGGFAGDVLGIGPPLIIKKEELDQVIDTFEWAVRGIKP